MYVTDFRDYKNEQGESIMQFLLNEMADFDDMQPMVNAIIRHSTKDNGEIEISSFIDHYFGSLIDAEDKKFGMRTIWVSERGADYYEYIDEEVPMDDLIEFVEKHKAARKQAIEDRKKK